MSRPLITTVILGVSAIATGFLILGSFVTHAQPISSVDMQNLYISRILAFGIPILLLQLIAVALVITAKKGDNAL